ncbi:hypothetical protein BZG36_03681 [Bifiguratus adelaidae]|uniref:Uncharacterized protein n=1 Tax=Bifiguratus adelaidae TaxID=1938954 RepID=A0A261XZS3_9FUNG|nr:hypothetical protein BZG36_03681 [Bifiguratus adelaidae]
MLRRLYTDAVIQGTLDAISPQVQGSRNTLYCGQATRFVQTRLDRQSTPRRCHPARALSGLSTAQLRERSGRQGILSSRHYTQAIFVDPTAAIEDTLATDNRRTVTDTQQADRARSLGREIGRKHRILPVKKLNERLSYIVSAEQDLDKAVEVLMRHAHYTREQPASRRPDATSFTIVMKAMLRDRQMAQALACFQTMLAERIQPDVTAFTCLIDGVMREADIDKTEAIIRQMVDMGIKPNSVTYNTLIRQSAVHFDMATAEQFLSDMKSAHYIPDQYTFGALIQGYRLHGQVEQAWKVYDDMMKSGVPLNTAIATTLMDMHLDHHDNVGVKYLYTQFFGQSLLLIESKQRSTDRTKRLKLPMQYPIEITGRLQPNAKTVNILLNAVLADLEPEELRSFYHMFTSPSNSTTKLPTQVKMPFTEKAKAFLGGRSSLTYTYNAFMRAFIRRNDTSKAFQVFADMKERNLAINDVTYGNILLAYSYLPDMAKAQGVFRDMTAAGVKPTIWHYTIMIRGWSRAKNSHMIRLLLDEMHDKGIQGNGHTAWALSWLKHQRDSDRL